jgi:peroxiredoxin
MTRIQPGDALAPRTLESVAGDRVQLPDPERLTHLQLRRFAGCPICNTHLQSFVRRHGELAAAGVREVVVFHSSPEALARHQSRLPFPAVADPAKRLYRELGVEGSVRSVLHPRVWLAGLKGVLSGRMGLPAWGESVIGLPGDFLMAPDGRVVAVKYGTHAYDQWSVDDVVTLAHQDRVVPGGR